SSAALRVHASQGCLYILECITSESLLTTDHRPPTTDRRRQTTDQRPTTNPSTRLRAGDQRHLSSIVHRPSSVVSRRFESSGPALSRCCRCGWERRPLGWSTPSPRSPPA